MMQPRCRKGLSMLELLLSSGLSLGLLLYLGDLWKQLPGWARRLSGRAGVVGEERLARAYLMSDLERAVSFELPGPSVLQLHLSAGDPSLLVEYSLQDGCLRRTDWPAGSSVTVSRYVEGLDCRAGIDGSVSVDAILQSGGIRRALSIRTFPL